MGRSRIASVMSSQVGGVPRCRFTPRGMNLSSQARSSIRFYSSPRHRRTCPSMGKLDLSRRFYTVGAQPGIRAGERVFFEADFQITSPDLAAASRLNFPYVWSGSLTVASDAALSDVLFSGDLRGTFRRRCYSLFVWSAGLRGYRPEQPVGAAPRQARPSSARARSLLRACGDRCVVKERCTYDGFDSNTGTRAARTRTACLPSIVGRRPDCHHGTGSSKPVSAPLPRKSRSRARTSSCRRPPVSGARWPLFAHHAPPGHW
jgi:hypothetical protein